MKPQHLSVVADIASLFMLALSRLVRRVFSGYLLPEHRETLSTALLVLIYGGREAYEFRNDLVKRAFYKEHEGDLSLALPDWDRFLKLFRQLLDSPLLDSPLETQYSPLILRETAFEFLVEPIQPVHLYLKGLVRRRQQAMRFCVLAVEYMVHACKLPSEFASKIKERLFTALAKDQPSGSQPQKPPGTDARKAADILDIEVTTQILTNEPTADARLPGTEGSTQQPELPLGSEAANDARGN